MVRNETAQPYNKVVIYYDHWEDDYEINLTDLYQSTTKIWSADDRSNGIPPGFASYIVNIGDFISLERSRLAMNVGR